MPTSLAVGDLHTLCANSVSQEGARTAAPEHITGWVVLGVGATETKRDEEFRPKRIAATTSVRLRDAESLIIK